MRIYTIERPYVLTFHVSGHAYRVSSEEAQRLIDAYPAVNASSNRVTLRGEAHDRCTLQPATIGGGIAFRIEKTR